MITKLLSTAVRLYLRSQVRQVRDLQVKISGRNRQILQGYIPEVFLGGQSVVYQGLHFSQAEVYGSEIAFNLAEVIQKKPLRLLEPTIVEVSLSLTQQDLQVSLDAALLQSGLQDLWQTIITNKLDITEVVWQNLAIARQRLRLLGKYQDASAQDHEINLEMDISLTNSHSLCLSKIKILNPETTGEQVLEPVEINLGTDVAITKLAIASEIIICQGTITIR